jgi:hypothetical protein
VEEKMNYAWRGETASRAKDKSGNWILHQFTSAPMISSNIYGEQPYTSPDGKRFAIIRSPDWTLYEGHALLVGDIPSLKMVVLEPPGQVLGIANSAWKGHLFCWVRSGRSKVVLRKISLMTFKKKDLLEQPYSDKRWRMSQSVSPDFKYLLSGERAGDNCYRILRLNISRGKWEIIFETSDPFSHLQYEPIYGNDILFQINKHWRVDKLGNWIAAGTDSTILALIDADGTNYRQLPMGRPFTRGATGHECFIPGTNRVLFSTVADFIEKSTEFWDSTLFVAAYGDEKPTPIYAPGHPFNHVSVSKCGTYFVADTYKDGPPGPIPLIVGNIATNKMAPLVETGTQGGGCQCTHPHPYFTADNKHVIYNSNLTGVPQVYVAVVPEEFLRALD